MELLQEAAARTSEAGDRLTEAVCVARANGVSWQQVGDALGVSKQAAHERFRAAEQAWQDSADAN